MKCNEYVLTPLGKARKEMIHFVADALIVVGPYCSRVLQYSPAKIVRIKKILKYSTNGYSHP